MKKIGILLVAVLLLASCSSKAEEMVAPELLTPAGVSMDTAIVQRKDISRKQGFVGTVVPEVEEVYFTMDGVVDELYVSYGDKVKKGDVLAVQDQERLAEQVEDLEKQIAHTKKLNDFTNQQLSYDVSICQAELNQQTSDGLSGAALALKQLELEEKRLILSQTQEMQALEIKQLNEQMDILKEKQGINTIKAPCDGTVAYVGIAPGDYAAAYSPVIDIANDSELYISSRQIIQSTVETAHSIYAKIGDNEYDVSYKPYESDEYLTMILSGGEIKTFFTIDNIDKNVKAGDFVVIVIDNPYSENALAIPYGALYTDEQSHYVYKIVDGRRVRCDVETGLITNLEAEITSGLEEGDEVYVKE